MSTFSRSPPTPFIFSTMSSISLPILTLRSSQPNLSFPSIFNLNRPFSTSLTSNAINHLQLVSSSTTSNQAVAETTSNSTINVQKDDALDTTLVIIRAKNRIGILQIITRVFKVFGIRIEKAIVEFEGEFFVSDSNGKKIEKREYLEKIQKALVEAIDGDDGGGASPSVAVSGRSVVVRKGGLKAKAEKMFGFMDGFLKNDLVSLQKDILDHVEFTVARSRFNFDEFEAYQAAADRAFVDQEKWTQMSILSTAGSGKFSSYRTIEEYAEQSWGIEPCKCPF